MKKKIIPHEVHFHSIGLGFDENINRTKKNNDDDDDGIVFKSLSSIANEVGDKQIDVLKIDIEGSEWNILDKFIDQDLDQIDVKQICIEIHLNHRITTPREVKSILTKLYHKGYELWNREDNIPHSMFIEWGGYHIRNAYELSFIKTTTKNKH